MTRGNNKDDATTAKALKADSVTKDKQTKPKSIAILRRLWKDAMEDKYSLLIGLLAMIGSAAANQAVPRMLGNLLDQKSNQMHTMNSHNYDTVTGIRTPSSLLLLVLGGGLSSFLRTTLLRRVQNSLICKRRSELFASLLSRNVEWFHLNEKDTQNNDNEKVFKLDTSPASLQDILTNDVIAMAETITSTLANTLRSLSSVMFGTINMCLIDAKLMGVSLSVVPLIGSAGYVLRKHQTKWTKQQHSLAMQAQNFANERMEHVATVKISSREMDEIKTHSKIMQEYQVLGQRASLAQGVVMGFMFGSTALALGLVFGTGGRNVKEGRLTYGQLDSMVMYSGLVGLGTNGFMRGWSQLMQGLVCAERVYDLMDSTSNDEGVMESSGKQQETKITVEANAIQEMEVTNATFSYASNPNVPVLKNVSLSIERGQVVALVGKNGSGKSTLASLLVALYQAQSGTVVCKTQTAEVDLNTLDRTNQSQIVQLVPQQPALFEMSVWDNVTYTNTAATKEQVEQALIAANCKNFVSKLTDGVQYNVGRNGCKLSGGQKQRLALARALLSNPALLILDEPNSSMDAEGDTAVCDAVKACRDGSADETRGLLLITHRQSSLALADTIVVLKDGVIVERGSYKDLSGNKDSELCQLMPDLQTE